MSKQPLVAVPNVAQMKISHRHQLQWRFSMRGRLPHHVDHLIIETVLPTVIRKQNRRLRYSLTHQSVYNDTEPALG